MEDKQGERYEKRAGSTMPPPRVPLSQYLHLFTSPEAPYTVFFAFMKASLRRHGQFNHWPLLLKLKLQSLSAP